RRHRVKHSGVAGYDAPDGPGDRDAGRHLKPPLSPAFSLARPDPSKGGEPMANSRKRMWGVAAGAIALGIVGASVAVAGLVSGGGPAKSDCYAEWDVKDVGARD